MAQSPDQRPGQGGFLARLGRAIGQAAGDPMSGVLYFDSGASGVDDRATKAAEAEARTVKEQRSIRDFAKEAKERDAILGDPNAYLDAGEPMMPYND